MAVPYEVYWGGVALGLVVKLEVGCGHGLTHLADYRTRVWQACIVDNAAR